MAIRDLKVVKKKFWFEDLIDEWFLRNNKKSNTIGYFRPSGLSNCQRENQYNYIGVAPYKDFDLGSLKRMHRGTMHHEMWEEIFRKAGIEVISGKPNRVEHDDPRITGEWDWKIRPITLPNGKRELIDWKSTQYMWSPPKIEYLIQWNLYAYLDGEIEDGFVIKEDPASLDFIPYPVKLERDFIVPYIDKLREIVSLSGKEIILPKDSRCGKGGKWPRSSCEIWRFCYSEQGDCPWDILRDKQIIDIRPSNKFACDSAEILNKQAKGYQYNIICDNCYNKEECEI